MDPRKALGKALRQRYRKIDQTDALWLWVYEVNPVASRALDNLAAGSAVLDEKNTFTDGDYQRLVSRLPAKEPTPCPTKP